MQVIKSAVFTLLISMTTLTLAETAQEALIKKQIEPRMGENVKVDSVTKTPYGGLFEIRSGGDIFYTDEKAQYLIVGRVIDTKTYQDLTQARVDEINKVKFTDLPLESAIKTVKGNGKRVIAVFEDPNCGYCKKFRHTLQDVDNVTVYTFLLNILADDSAGKSKNIWCSADRSKAWDDWMLDGKMAANAPANCSTPNDKITELGKKLKIPGTPTIVFVDGSRSVNALDAKALEARFSALK